MRKDKRAVTNVAFGTNEGWKVMATHESDWLKRHYPKVHDEYLSADDGFNDLMAKLLEPARPLPESTK